MVGGQVFGEIAAGTKLIDYGARSFAAASKLGAPTFDMALGYTQNGLNNLTMGKDFNDGALRAVGVSLIGHGAGLYTGGKMQEIGMQSVLSERGPGGYNLLSNINLGYRSSSTIFSHEAAGLGAATGVGVVNGLADLNSTQNR